MTVITNKASHDIFMDKAGKINTTLSKNVFFERAFANNDEADAKLRKR